MSQPGSTTHMNDALLGWTYLNVGENDKRCTFGDQGQIQARAKGDMRIFGADLD